MARTTHTLSILENSESLVFHILDDGCSSRLPRPSKPNPPNNCKQRESINKIPTTLRVNSDIICQTKSRQDMRYSILFASTFRSPKKITSEVLYVVVTTRDRIYTKFSLKNNGLTSLERPSKLL